MKHLILYISLFYLIGCNLFQGQQPVEENVAVEENQQQEEVFVPVQKELYVINPKTMQYTEPDIHSEPKDRLNSFGHLLKIEAESEHFYKIKSSADCYLLKENMGTYNEIPLTKEILEAVQELEEGENEFDISKEGKNLSDYFTISLIPKQEYQKELKNRVDFRTPIKNFTYKEGVLYINHQAYEVEKENIEWSNCEKVWWIAPLQRYLAYITYQGDVAYGFFILIEKDTKKTIKLEQEPFLSPDFKYLFCTTNPTYMNYTKISLYNIQKDSIPLIEMVAQTEINYWMPYHTKETPLFFSSNGNIYASFNVEGLFWKGRKEVKLNDQRMYIKIGIRN